MTVLRVVVCERILTLCRCLHHYNSNQCRCSGYWLQSNWSDFITWKMTSKQSALKIGIWKPNQVCVQCQQSFAYLNAIFFIRWLSILSGRLFSNWELDAGSPKTAERWVFWERLCVSIESFRLYKQLNTKQNKNRQMQCRLSSLSLNVTSELQSCVSVSSMSSAESSSSMSLSGSLSVPSFSSRSMPCFDPLLKELRLTCSPDMASWSLRNTDTHTELWNIPTLQYTNQSALLFGVLRLETQFWDQVRGVLPLRICPMSNHHWHQKTMLNY